MHLQKWLSASPVFCSPGRHDRANRRRGGGGALRTVKQARTVTVRVYIVFSFFVVKFANEKLIFFLNLRTKNDFLYRFLTSYLTNEKQETRNSFFVCKFENEKGKEGEGRSLLGGGNLILSEVCRLDFVVALTFLSRRYKRSD